MWLRLHVTWLWTWVAPTASYHSAKFGGHRYCRSSDVRFYFCQVTTPLKRHVTWRMLYPVLSYHHVNFVGSRPCGKEDVTFHFQFQYQYQFQCLQITNIQPKTCVSESYSFCKLIQKKDQISICKLMFRWPYI